MSAVAALLPSAPAAIRVPRLLSHALRYPGLGWRGALADLLAPADADAACPPLAEMRAALAAEDDAVLAAEHFRLFGPDPAAPVGLVPYLTANPFEQARRMAELAGYFRAFGLTWREGERPDALDVALEFLAYLNVKRAHAAATGGGEREAVTDEAARGFVRDLVAPAAAAWGRSVEARATTAFYRTLARACVAWLGREAAA